MSRQSVIETVKLDCPKCGRFLCEVERYGRAICKYCGWEIEVRSPELRKRVDKYPLGGGSIGA